MSAGARESRPRDTGRPGRVLLVDDEPALLRLLARALERDGHQVIARATGEEALAVLDGLPDDPSSRGEPFDAVLTDLGLPGLNGLELLRAIRRRDLDVAVVILTGSPSVESAVEAMDYGAMQYLVKPVAADRVRNAVLRAVRLARIARAKREALAQSTHGAMHRAGDRAGLEATFDRMLASVTMAFQPILDREGRLFGHEALLRSNEPALPDPGAVLDAADALGRSMSLGRHLRAIAAARALDAPTSGALFVNLHPDDILDDALLDSSTALSTLRARVVLEVTERAAITNLERMRARIVELREAGYRLAIDDLGAGYAGLNAFAALEPEVVKLDMSLVRDIEQIATKRKVVRAMSALCHDLGIQVVAEGIETTAELDVLLDAGCDLFQGYLFARPGPPFPTFTWPR